MAEARLAVMVIFPCTGSHLSHRGRRTPRHRALTARARILYGVAFDYPGDYALAAALFARGKAKDHLAVLATGVRYPLDYGP